MTSPSPADATARCATHPARPAVDSCPTCGRPRCGADVRGARCLVCTAQLTSTGRPPGRLELVVRGTLAAYGVALVAAVINSQYVGSDWFSYLAPAVAGVATGSAATTAAPGRLALGPVRVVSVVLGVLAVAMGLVLEGTYDAYDPEVEVVVPYLIAGVAAWLWTAPPRRRRKVKGPAGA